MEVYNNVYQGTGASNSSVDRVLAQCCFTTILSREFYKRQLGTSNIHFPVLGSADGTNPWDVNEPTVFTGTAATTARTLPSPSPVLTGRGTRWAGYMIRRTSNNCNSNTITFGWINSNTSNTISYTGNGGSRPTPSWPSAQGTRLKFARLITPSINPAERGGSLITGNLPVRPAGWNIK